MDSQKKPQPDTKSRIMDAAERLFAIKGFQGTSIKRLACEAGVNQAAVNYHFGSKTALIEKVIDRRLTPINQQRMQRLEAVRRTAVMEHTRPLVKDVLRAFIEPVFTISTSMEANRCFIAMESWAFSEPDATVRSIFNRRFQAPFRLLSMAMRSALPDLSEDMLIRRLHFAIGAMAHWLRLSSVNLPPSEFFPPVDDFDNITNLLLDFATSGMQAPCQRKMQMD